MKAGFGRSISHTTRTPRSGEVDGIDYHFVTKAEFEEMVAAGQMIEHAEFNGEFYGTSVEAARLALRDTGRMVAVVEPIGAAQIREYCDENGILICSTWVACDVEDQMMRFVQERMPSLSPEKAAARLTAMMTTEAGWRRSASVGRINGSPYRYSMEFWMAGSDMEEIYVDGIVRWVATRQKPTW